MKGERRTGQHQLGTGYSVSATLPLQDGPAVDRVMSCWLVIVGSLRFPEDEGEVSVAQASHAVILQDPQSAETDATDTPGAFPRPG